jgi:hypothetical protein
MTRQVTDFELIDHGIDGSQYFPGCGTSFTDFAHVATGCGDNPAEALDDLLEQVASSTSGLDIDDLERRILESENNGNPFPELPSAFQRCLEANGFDEEPTEPDRDDFDTDEEFEEAYNDWETRLQEYQEFTESADVYYYLSLRWSEAPIDATAT